MNNIKNNKTKKNKSIPLEATTSNTPFRVITQNVRGLNSPSKQLQIERIFIDDNLSVYGPRENKIN